MNKIIMKLALPAIAAGMGFATTGCVATRCYEGYPVTAVETTYVTPAVETVYFERPVYRTVTPPPRHHAEPRKPAHRPHVQPAPKAQQKPHGKPAQKQIAKAPNKAPRQQPKQQAKAAPQKKPAAQRRKRG